MKKSSVEFTVNNEVLRGTLFAPSGEGPFPAVVFYHGRGSSRARYLPIAKKLAKEGILTLAFDFRGCGQSDGSFEKQSYKNGIEDGRAAVAFVLTQDIDENRIGLCGTSLGGYVVGMVLPRYPFVKSILLRAPAAYSDNLQWRTGINDSGFFANRANWKNSSSYKGITNYKGTLLVLKCEKDGLLPDELVERYYHEAKNAKKRELATLKGADHILSNPTSLHEFYQIIHDWFLKAL